MEESSGSYRRIIADFVKEKERRKSNHQSRIKKYPPTNDASVRKEMKRKTEGNSTPSSPMILRKKMTLSASRYRKLLNDKKEKGDSAEDTEIEHSPHGDSKMPDTGKSMCLRCSKLKRKSNDSHHQFCSCSTQVGEETTSFEDSKGLQMKTSCSGETTQRDDSYYVCVKCRQPGSLMHCGGKDCKRSYHPSCLDPPLSEVPFGTWLCFCCLRKKMEFGVYSVSQGIESILDSNDDVQKEKRYLVKFKGLAHFHNLWIPRSRLLIKDSVLLTKFDKKQQRGQEIGWKHEWTEPHRLLQQRLLVPPKQIDVCSCEHGDNIEYCYVEWFVKWKGLGYQHATWEFENSKFLCSAYGKALIDEFVKRRVEAKKKSNPSQINKDLCVRENPLKNLSKLADGLPVELNYELLTSVCNIIKHWHKNQNAIIIDDQEANIKSILFISHLLSYTCRPFLLISTIPSLSTWEAEFVRLAPSINVVVYSGNKDVRELIRSLEFYEEGGCVMFNVLIASPDVIVEDLLYLNCLGWEGVVIDDCQKAGISKHFEQFAILSSEFRLLILNSVPKEAVADYYKLLSFLDIKGQSSPHYSKSDSSENGDELSILKKRLKHYVVHEGKRTSSRFLEYWVPVQLSALQLKQYCSILTSNSLLLRSRFDYVEKLLDVLKSIRMCCDHPYLADHTLQDSLTSNLTQKECLNVGVNASSKFQLLDKILLEMKKLGLKVLILIQPESSEYHLGHILDDFLCERFGDASFVYINKLVEKPKIGSILKKFNDDKSETFIVVIEKLACRPRIKFSSVDAIIIFNTDWNPMNDMKAVKKITLCSQTPVKIFRLYSPYSVEEKILCSAKDDLRIETDIENTSTKFRHSLLTWGASCLFNKLNELDSSNAHTESLVDESLLKEMLHILATPTGNKDTFTVGKCSKIVYAHISGDFYSKNISLCGDKDECAFVHGDPVIFWSKLFETSAPPHPSCSSLRTRYANAQISDKSDGRKEQILSMPALESLKTQKASVNHNIQLHTSSNGNQMELEEGEIKEDAADHGFEVDKIFLKRMEQILFKQGQETTVFKNQRNQEKDILIRYHDSVLQSAGNNTEARKNLRNDISKEQEQFVLHVKLQRKKLLIMQIEARNKEKQIKDQWLEKASKGMSIEPYESLPLADTGFKYVYFNVSELLEETNNDESRCKMDSSTSAQNEVQTHSKRNPFQNTLLSAEEFPKIPSPTSQEKMEHIIIEDKISDSDGRGIMKTETEALSVTSLQNALNSNKMDSATDIDITAVYLHGSESALSSDTTSPKEMVGTGRNSSQSAHAHGAHEHADNISDRMPPHCAPDRQQETLNIGAVVEDNVTCEEEPEQVIVQSEDAQNSPESEHARNSPECEHAHNSPQSEHAINSPECEHAHISCEPVVCSGLGRVRPVSSSLSETAQLNNLRTATSQPQSSDFLLQFFATSQSITPEEFRPDPLQNELTMMSRRELSISLAHQKKKLTLAEECEKELEEVRKKYALLVQNEEAVYNQHLMVINELKRTIQKNQILAELFKSNFIEVYKHGNTEEFGGGEPNQPVVQSLTTMPTASNIPLRAPAPHLRRFT